MRGEFGFEGYVCSDFGAVAGLGPGNHAVAAEPLSASQVSQDHSASQASLSSLAPSLPMSVDGAAHRAVRRLTCPASHSPLPDSSRPDSSLPDSSLSDSSLPDAPLSDSSLDDPTHP